MSSSLSSYSGRNYDEHFNLFYHPDLEAWITVTSELFCQGIIDTRNELPFIPWARWILLLKPSLTRVRTPSLENLLESHPREFFWAEPCSSPSPKNLLRVLSSRSRAQGLLSFKCAWRSHFCQILFLVLTIPWPKNCWWWKIIHSSLSFCELSDSIEAMWIIFHSTPRPLHEKSNFHW